MKKSQPLIYSLLELRKLTKKKAATEQRTNPNSRVGVKIGFFITYWVFEKNLQKLCR